MGRVRHGCRRPGQGHAHHAGHDRRRRRVRVRRDANVGILGGRRHGRALTPARERTRDRLRRALHGDRRRMRRRLRRQRGVRGCRARRERDGGRAARVIPRPRQLQGPVPVQWAPELSRQGTGGERDGLGRLLDRRHVRLRGHERVDLVGPQQRLTSLAFVQRGPGLDARGPFMPGTRRWTSG